MDKMMLFPDYYSEYCSTLKINELWSHEKTCKNLGGLLRSGTDNYHQWSKRELKGLCLDYTMHKKIIPCL